KATATVTASWVNATYDGTPKAATASVAGVGSPAAVLTTPAATLAYYAGATATGTALAGAPTAAGTDPERGAFAGDDNYNAASGDKTITIAKATATVTASWVNATYDGAAKPATASVAGVGTPAAVLSDPAATFTYYTGSTPTGTALSGAPTDAG